MKDKIHYAVRPGPIDPHGLKQVGLCGYLIEKAYPVNITPDAAIVSVGILADTFGNKFCRKCKELEPGEGYVYFLATSEFVENLRSIHEYAEVS